MGDRAIVVFHNNVKFSPGIYLHWSGHRALSLLKESLPRLREGDLGYSSARFCGYCHNQLEGNLGLGLLRIPENIGFSVDEWRKVSHGDSGVFLVNVNDWSVRQITSSEDVTTLLQS